MIINKIYIAIIMLLLAVSVNAQYTTYDQIYHTDEYGMQTGYSTTRDFGFQEQTTHSDQYGQITGYSTTRDYGFGENTTHTDQYGSINDHNIDLTF